MLRGVGRADNPRVPGLILQIESHPSQPTKAQSSYRVECDRIAPNCSRTCSEKSRQLPVHGYVRPGDRNLDLGCYQTYRQSPNQFELKVNGDDQGKRKEGKKKGCSTNYVVTPKISYPSASLRPNFQRSSNTYRT